MQNLQVNNSIRNAKFSGYYFYINLNILGEIQICISAPLKNYEISIGCVSNTIIRSQDIIFTNSRIELLIPAVFSSEYR